MTINTLKFKKGEATHDVASKIDEDVKDTLNNDFEDVNAELETDIIVNITIDEDKN